MRNKNGFTIVEIVILIAVLAIIGALGYMAYNNLIAGNSTNSKDAASSNQTVAPVVVKSSSDLEKVTKELDAMSLEDSDSTSQLDTAASSF